MRTILFATVARLAVAAFMSDTCPTVTVKTKNGLVIVNKEDYDANPDDYTLASKADQEPQPVPPSPMPVAENVTVPPALAATDLVREPVPPSNPSPGTICVAKAGTAAKPRWFASLADGTLITDKGDNVPPLDPKGYDDENAANAAVLAYSLAQQH